MTHFPLRLLIFVYSTFMEAAGILAAFVLRSSRLSRQWNLRERRGVPAPAAGHPATQSVWLHAASLGEAKLLSRFLDILRSKHPGQSYLLTATTRTGVEYLTRTARPDVAAAGYLPLDSVRLMRSVLSTYRVSRVWILETELWPSMLWACAKAGIPVGLVNARIEEESLVWYRRFAWLLAPLFSHPDVVLAQDQGYADRFARLGVSRLRIRVTGNLKRSAAVHPVSPEERAVLRKKMGLAAGERCITAGCLHPGEGAVIAGALAALRRMSYPVKCIVVPRHLKDGDTLAAELGNGVVRVTDAEAGAGWDVCMVEKMGVMEAMYKIADAAFVGGTFDDTGGHNMWDAAQFGIPVVFGPDFRTQKESGDELIAAGVAFPVDSAEGLATAVASVLRDQAPLFANAQAAFAAKISASNHAIEDLIP
jgi:3-deoxy-D-manno-octulosonic-acid transferase